MKILDVNDIQGDFIRSIANRDGDVTLHMYRDAHVIYMHTVPNRALHQSPLTLVMEVNYERWNPQCPECAAGVTTGRLWPEARCFGCGAIFSKVVWPTHIVALENILLKRPPKFRHWKPEQTLGQLIAENIQFGLGVDLVPQLTDGAAIRGLLTGRI